MKGYLVGLCMAGIIAYAERMRRTLMANLSRDGFYTGQVVSVTLASRRAYGGPTRWYEVLIRYADETGLERQFLHDDPGSAAWKPEAGATVHLFRRNVPPGPDAGRRRGIAAPDTVLECARHGERFLAKCRYAILACS